MAAEHGPAAVEALFGGVFAEAEQLSRFVGGHLFAVAEQEHGAVGVGDEAEGGIENIDVGLVFYKIFNFVSAESWSWFGIVHSAVIGATSNIPIRRATTFAIHATNFQRYQIALLSINH